MVFQVRDHRTMTSEDHEGRNARRVHLFINNPHADGYADPTGMDIGYDVLTDKSAEATCYSVPVNRRSIGDGDVAVVYRVGGGAKRRDPGAIVAYALITSSPWKTRTGNAQVNWRVQPLPLEAWIHSSDMIKSGHWAGHTPFTQQTQASSPVELDPDQWGWIFERLPEAALQAMTDHAEG